MRSHYNSSLSTPFPHSHQQTQVKSTDRYYRANLPTVLRHSKSKTTAQSGESPGSSPVRLSTPIYTAVPLSEDALKYSDSTGSPENLENNSQVPVDLDIEQEPNISSLDNDPLETLPEEGDPLNDESTTPLKSTTPGVKSASSQLPNQGGHIVIQHNPHHTKNSGEDEGPKPPDDSADDDIPDFDPEGDPDPDKDPDSDKGSHHSSDNSSNSLESIASSHSSHPLFEVIPF